jgi:hypothetical protein
MSAFSFRDALTHIQRKMKDIKTRGGNDNIMLAVTGYVASGKSHLCSILRSNIEALLRNPPLYLPFDLWINTEKREAAKYAERFFLTDLIEAVRCIRDKTHFLVPRYDIVKTTKYIENAAQLSAPELLWNGRPFLPYRSHIDVPLIRGATNLYVDQSNNYPYSLFPATAGECYLLDGTLIAPREISDYYDLKVFVQAPWPMRVARMIRRFNRKEVFGTTKKTMRDYVGFLVAEARECADAEIQTQLDGNTIVVESIPDTLSNYLDLAYLLWLTKQKNAPDWVNRQDVEETMYKYLECLQEIHDVASVSRYRLELNYLMESKHLLALPDVDQLLTKLTSIFH